MPEALNSVAVSWRDGASLQGSGMAVSWRDGASVYGTGGAYVPHSAPAGSTPAAPLPAAVGSSIAPGASYVTTHTITVIDERDETAVPVVGLTISTDADSFMWALTAHGGEALRVKLLAGAQPAVLRVTVDGDVWRFIVDSVSRSRAHPASSVTVTARSPTVLAAAPYEGDQTWTNDEVATAAQLAATANLYTGVEVSWEIDDWIIPARVFNFTTTPLGVVKAVADAAGAMVLSDKAELRVRVVPRYRLMPNEWAVSPPDVELPIDCIATDAFERADKPAYNAVPLSGQQQGVTATVRLAGTDGGNMAPLVTDLLLTEPIALQMRGMSILGAGGEQARVTLRVPVIYGEGRPGTLGIGQLVRVVDTDETWHGVVRAVAVDVEMPSAYQTVVLERHTRPIEGTVVDATAADPLVYTGPLTMALTVGVPFTLSLAPHWSGGETPYTWSLRSGALPAGLTLDPTTGVVSGTPTSTDPFSVRFRAVDAVFNMADSDIASGTPSAGAVVDNVSSAGAIASAEAFGSPTLTTPATLGDPLWSNVWGRWTFDSSAADLGPNSLGTTRSSIGSGLNATSDVQTTAAKYGTKGWLCYRDDSANTASAVVANLTSAASGVRTWGTQDWWVGGWVRVGDNSTPSATRQRRFNLAWESTNGLWFSTLAGVVNVQLRSTATANPFSSATIGTVAGGTGSTLSTPAGTLNDNNYHHVACGRNGSTFRIWVDGVVRAECTVSMSLPAIDQVSLGGVPALGVATVTSGSPTVAADYLDDWVVYLGNANVTTQFFSPPAEALPIGSGVMRTVYTGATNGVASPALTTAGAPLAARNAFVAACSNTGVIDFEDQTETDVLSGASHPFVGATPSRSATITVSGGAHAEFDANLTYGTTDGTFNTTGASSSANNSGIYLYVEPPTTLAVNFSAAVAAFGCYITDVGDSNEQIIARLTKSGGGTLDYMVPHSTSTASGQCLFWGFADPTGQTYTKVEFIISSSGGSVGFDDLLVGVPA